MGLHEGRCRALHAKRGAGTIKGAREVREVMRAEREEGGATAREAGGPATVQGRPSAWCMQMQDHVYVPHVQGELARGM